MSIPTSMPAGSGRKIDLAWSEVTKIENSFKVACKHCGEELSGKVERIKVHLDRCWQRNLPTDDHAEVENVAGVGGSGPSTSGEGASQDAASNDGESSAKKRKFLQQSMNSYSVKTTAAEKESLDLKIASFFYANNIAFNAANSKQYHEMISALRPEYTGPSSDQIGGQLLDKVNEKVDKKLAAEISDKSSLTLIMDGWSSVRNDPINATSIHTGSKSYLLETSDCGADKKTAEYCAEKLIGAMGMCQKKFGKQVNTKSN